MSDPIKSIAHFIVHQYDTDGDGRIKLPEPMKPCSGGEENVCKIPTDEVYREVGEEGVATRALLFVEADADHDGFASVEEVEAVLRRFDRDGSGKLEAEERRAFNAQFREKRVM